MSAVEETLVENSLPFAPKAVPRPAVGLSVSMQDVERERDTFLNRHDDSYNDCKTCTVVAREWVWQWCCGMAA